MDALKNIRKNNLKTVIFMLLFAFFPNAGLVVSIKEMIEYGFDENKLFLLIICGLFSVIIDIGLYRTLIKVINPYNSDLFKKYGTLEEVNKIIKEISNTIEYEDKNLIISKKYICDKKDYEKIMACDDILGIHKLVHKTNMVIDYYQVVITDKYGQEALYSYGIRELEKLNKIMIVISNKCKNAELGYTKKEQEHIKNNMISLKKKIEIEEYKCPDCENTIQFGDKFCKECGCKIDWTE